MSGIAGLIVELLRRLVRNWPRKLVTLVAAFFLWWLIGASTTTITQRSFVIPLMVEGVEPEALAVGVPDVVEVSITGAGPRVDRIRPDQLRATLDLTGASGDFEERVVVQTPPETSLQSVAPSNVIGFLEAAAERSVTVDVAVIGAPPDGSVPRFAASPTSVNLKGRQQQLSAVSRAVALVTPGGGEAAVVALDVDGHPVEGVTSTPATVEVIVSSRAVFYSTEVLVELVAPLDPALLNAELSKPTATVAGPPELIAELVTVGAEVDPPTGALEPGLYTFPVTLELPDGVFAVNAPSATLLFGRDMLSP